jgi:hypothetical protein
VTLVRSAHRIDSLPPRISCTAPPPPASPTACTPPTPKAASPPHRRPPLVSPPPLDLLYITGDKSLRQPQNPNLKASPPPSTLIYHATRWWRRRLAPPASSSPPSLAANLFSTTPPSNLNPRQTSSSSGGILFPISIPSTEKHQSFKSHFTHAQHFKSMFAEKHAFTIHLQILGLLKNFPYGGNIAQRHNI